MYLLNVHILWYFSHYIYILNSKRYAVAVACNQWTCHKHCAIVCESMMCMLAFCLDAPKWIGMIFDLCQDRRLHFCFCLFVLFLVTNTYCMNSVASIQSIKVFIWFYSVNHLCRIYHQPTTKNMHKFSLYIIVIIQKVACDTMWWRVNVYVCLCIVKFHELEHIRLSLFLSRFICFFFFGNCHHDVTWNIHCEFCVFKNFSCQIQ